MNATEIEQALQAEATMSEATKAIQIKRRHSNTVLFEGEPGALMAEVLRKAMAQNVDLTKADLYGADLRNADLSSIALGQADLRYADLRGIILTGANLYYADLRGADLRNADLRATTLTGATLQDVNLDGADMERANLYGVDMSNAKLGDKKLVGSRPYFVLGPVGRGGRFIHAWSTDAGLLIQYGCFFGSRDEYLERAKNGLIDSAYDPEYEAAIIPIDLHHEIWSTITHDVAAQMTASRTWQVMSLAFDAEGRRTVLMGRAVLDVPGEMLTVVAPGGQRETTQLYGGNPEAMAKSLLHGMFRKGFLRDDEANSLHR